MIDKILPGAVVAVETGDDEALAELFPEEREAVGNAVEERRREFGTGRECAHRALEGLGLARSPIGTGPKGEPRWPAGVVGSITHCEGYRACAVARREVIATIGIDAEPHEPLPEGVLPDIALPEEARALAELSRRLPAIHWDRLLFCAKETVYKAWFPLAERWLGFEDATITLDPQRCSFEARLLVPGPEIDGMELRGFSGRWTVRDGLVAAAIAQPAERP